MKKVVIALVLFSLSLAYAEKPTRLITDTERQHVYAIGKANGVPLSVVRQQIKEESDGFCDAISPMTKEGYFSKGVLQLYDKPGNIDWLLSMFWKEDVKEFDIYDPIDNATLAIRYMAWLHKRFGNWYEACIYYNCGNISKARRETKAYARRIVNAK
jgi:hypothetical protein